MRKILLFALVASTISCQNTSQMPETTLSSYYLIDTVNSIHNAIVAEIDSVMYVVPNYKTVNFNNKDSILKLHDVIRYCQRLAGDYAHYDKDDPRLYKLLVDNSDGVEKKIILKYDSTVNGIKLYRFVFTPENFLLILQTKKVNHIFNIEKGFLSDVYYTDGFIKEYVPVLLPLFSKKDLNEIYRRFSELIQLNHTR